MGVWTNVLIISHVLVALGIIGLVLLQHGKGADMGSGFGGGASGSLFGATGSANFLSRATAALAAVFFLLSLTLAWVATNRSTDRGEGGVMDTVKQQQQQQSPALQVPQPAAKPQPAVPAEKPAAQPAEPSDKQVPQ